MHKIVVKPINNEVTACVLKGFNLHEFWSTLRRNSKQLRWPFYKMISLIKLFVNVIDILFVLFYFYIAHYTFDSNRIYIWCLFHCWYGFIELWKIICPKVNHVCVLSYYEQALIEERLVTAEHTGPANTSWICS